MAVLMIYENFLKNKKHFEWFILEYFGEQKMKELIALAELKNTRLLSELNEIWFRLPDSKFNIIKCPKGWVEFLDVVEV